MSRDASFNSLSDNVLGTKNDFEALLLLRAFDALDWSEMPWRQDLIPARKAMQAQRSKSILHVAFNTI